MKRTLIALLFIFWSSSVIAAWNITHANMTDEARNSGSRKKVSSGIDPWCQGLLVKCSLYR
ncbi:hypothetical protein [Endozoicomonas numazuensis]|uniref:hypothetical protein n=1 Tax=Endozoicomonas numazuensis TaxID=1137799 RepID=UPI000B292603|nr:hypothetical protein [Endozoicomonas numazuensis]